MDLHTTSGPRTRSVGRWLALATLTAAALQGCAPAGERGVTGPRAYIDRLGNDTISAEAYTRTADGFEGDVLVRAPLTRVAHYEATLTPDGHVSRLDVEWRVPPQNPDGGPAFGVTYVLEGDSVTIARHGSRGGRGPDTLRVAAPAGAIPTIGVEPYAYALLEQAIRQAGSPNADSVPFVFLNAGGRTTQNAVVRLGGDTVQFDLFGDPLLVRAGPDGRVVALSGARTTAKVEGQAAPDLDLQALAADFAARDARGEGMGVPSPLDTTTASVDGATLSVVYSRPARRGREIWGKLVPWDEVWRTGANAATALSTDRDLEIAGVRVPAGDYTLYSIYTPDSAKLIINQQTGQWGTEYHPERDLARIALAREELPRPMERFTISIEPTDGGGVLRLAWGGTAFSVPIVVR